MLYISNTVTDDVYEVYDTDDCTFNNLSESDIFKLHNSGIKVQGVSDTDIKIFDVYKVINKWLLLGQVKQKLNKYNISSIGDFIGLPNYKFSIVNNRIHLNRIIPKKNIFEYTIPDFTNSIDSYCFIEFDKTRYYNIKIGRGIKTLPRLLFYDFFLNNIIIPNTVEIIEQECFSNTSINNLQFESNRVNELYLGNKCFKFCICSSKLNIDGMVSISKGRASFNNSAFKGITIKNISDSSCGEFSYMQHLEELTIDGEFTELVNSSIYGNLKLKSVRINSKNLTSIGFSCFNYCLDLKEVFIESVKLNRIEQDCFVSCNEDLVIFCRSNEVAETIRKATNYRIKVKVV